MLDRIEARSPYPRVKPEMKEKKSLSFSISRILGNDTQEKEEQGKREQINTEPPRVPHPALHLYHTDRENNFLKFDFQMHPTSCSTPDNKAQSDIQIPRPMYADSSYKCYFYPEDFNKNHTTPEDRKQVPLRATHNIDNLVNLNNKNTEILKENYQNNASPMKSKKKKTRTVFSRSQIYQLESAFETKRYLSSAERAGLANQLQLTETQIKIWFQNRRNKWKRQISGEMDEIPLPPFAHPQMGLLSPNFCTPENISTFSPLSEPRDDLLRGGMMFPPIYSHPYAQENRLRSNIYS